MQKRLEGRVAIVTGGSQGIGRAVASAFCREGARVLITGRTEGALLEAAAQIRGAGGVIESCVADIAEPADAGRVVSRAVELFGGLHVMVNNAATSRPGTNFEDTDEDLLQLTIQSSLSGTFRYMNAAMPHLKASGGGAIINFGSRTGVEGMVGFGAYAAAKEGIRGLSRVAAREWGKYNIRVNVVCPAALSPISKTFLEDNPETAQQILSSVALGRIGDPDLDIAPAVVFLASDDARYITGQTIAVDGGQIML
ncbi:SDR family NAD(P)-dependent oxidoreductase [Novosphingobium cyanobacteriorum]|uniref:SDR family NAD(P)-dependent oxidoreductase n=1 Tax=Novosphingobium cyanobacteriorum TaxID=3024215 RepID=A0ABT6CN26_9SPHN|nr:SDR family NAD(P)-dependent oxidoreductase [Novosphingobium cyanobacteriorum]MDF8335315.1 SDR family NAD(P)-dependent oxidoreductase [Novosphingobium cyanobacteriorum]